MRRQRPQHRRRRPLKTDIHNLIYVWAARDRMLCAACLLGPSLPRIGPPRADGAGATANVPQGRASTHMATAIKRIDEQDDMGRVDQDYRPSAAEEFMNPQGLRVSERRAQFIQTIIVSEPTMVEPRIKNIASLVAQ